MIKAIRIDEDFRSKREFDALRRFLELLGCRNETGSAEEQSRDVTLSAPLAKVAIGWEAGTKDVANPWNFAIEVDDPDAAHVLLREKGYEVLSDVSEYQTGWRQFIVQIFPGFRVAVLGAPDHWMGMKRAGVLRAGGLRFAVVVSRFNSFITQRLAQAAVDALTRLGATHEEIRIVDVPGAFEIPSVSRTLAETRRYDAIICIGCLLRGDTAHYDVIVNEVTRGIGQSAQETGVPHAFGVLTCDTLEQAIDRAGLKMGNKGFEAALAAVEMANLKSAVSSQLAAVNKGKRAPASRKRKRAPASPNRRS
jgi:6,7-dimethyl-8-ribityllumazine synthase